MEECLREGGLAEIQCASRGYRLKGVDSSTGVLTKNGRVMSVGGGGVGTYEACRLQNYQPDYQPDYQLRADSSNCRADSSNYQADSLNYQPPVGPGRLMIQLAA